MISFMKITYIWIIILFLSPIDELYANGRKQLRIDESELLNKRGTELYEVLRKWHVEADRQDASLVYPHGLLFEINIPKGANSLPLPQETDFNDCHFVVDNTAMDNFFLFTMKNKNKEKRIVASCRQISSGQFYALSELSSGLILMRIKDKNRWTHRAPEEGDYDIFRQDVLLLKNGQAINRTIFPYWESTSNPECYYCVVDDEQKILSNLVFTRSKNSTMRTFLLKVTMQNNVLIKNVKVVTPFVSHDSDNQLYWKDYCFQVSNCTNVTFEDVCVRGTYSAEKKYGYAVNLENVWNSNFIRFDAEAHWGAFGNNNINNISLLDCHINRFDLHSYGSDVTCLRCTFSNQIDETHPGQEYSLSNVLNAFGSMFGKLLFIDCHFVQARPVYLRANYMAYTGFDVVFEDCVFDINPQFSYFVMAGNLDEPDAFRPELRGKKWPNVEMNNCIVNLPEQIKNLYMFYAFRNSSTHPSIGYLSSIGLKNVKVNYTSVTPPMFKVSNLKVKVAKHLKLKVKRTTLKLITDSLVFIDN